MSRVCEVTGKKPTVGNHVSHANNKTKRRWLPNLQYRKFWVESENRWVRMRLSNAGLRLIDGAHLFEANTSLIAVRRGGYLRNYAYRFIELCSPALPEQVVRAAVMADGSSAKPDSATKPDSRPDALARRAASAPAQLWRSTGNTLSRDEVNRTA